MLLAPVHFHCPVSPIPLRAMYFSDDEDFFARAADDQEELLSFEGYESFQPYEQMLPEDEMIPEAEQLELGIEDDESFQPCHPRVERVEEPPTSPSLTSDTVSLSSTSPPRPLPTLESGGRKRLREKTKPTGPWIGNGASAPMAQASYQPLGLPGVPSMEAARNEWWDAKLEREKETVRLELPETTQFVQHLCQDAQQGGNSAPFRNCGRLLSRCT